MNLVKSMLKMLKSISNYFATIFTNSSYELDKHNDSNINIAAIRADFAEKSKKEIEMQKDKLKSAKLELKKNISDKQAKEEFLKKSIIAIDSMDEIIKNEATEDLHRLEVQGEYNIVKIHANQAIKTVDLLERSIATRTDMIAQMTANIQKNQEEALVISLELEHLALEKDLTLTAKSLTSIKLSDRFDLQKLKDVVESERDIFLIGKEVDKQFNSDQTEVLEKYTSDTVESSDKLEQMLNDYRCKKAA